MSKSRSLAKKLLACLLSLTVLSVSLVMFAAASDDTETATTVGTIVGDLTGQTTETTWISLTKHAGTAYTLSIDNAVTLNDKPTAKLSYDVTGELAMGAINPETNPPKAGDGLRFVAKASQKTVVRIAVSFDWCQRYYDFTIDTQPKEYTLRWEDAKTFDGVAGFDPAVNTYYVQTLFTIIPDLQDASFSKKGDVWVNDVIFFEGNATTNTDGKAISSDETASAVGTIVGDLTGQTTETMKISLTKHAGTAYALSIDNAVTLNDKPTAKLSYDVTGELAMGAINPETNPPKAGDGLRFVAKASQKTVVRIAVSFDWCQRYYDFTIDTEPKEYTLRWEDAKMFDGVAGFDPAVNTYYVQTLFTIMPDLQDASFSKKGDVWVNDVIFFEGNATTNTDGKELVFTETTTTTESTAESTTTTTETTPESTTTTTETTPESTTTTTETTPESTTTTTAPAPSISADDRETTDLGDFEDWTDDDAALNWLVYNDATNNTISLDTGKKIQGNNSILWEYSKVKDSYATAGYCPDLSKFVYGDGIKFSARADKSVRVRLSVVVDDMQMYTFFTVGTEAKDYVLRWEDMGDFSATADGVPRWDPSNNGFLNRLVFTIFDDDVAANPASGNVWLDDFSFFSGSTPTIDEGIDYTDKTTGTTVAPTQPSISPNDKETTDLGDFEDWTDDDTALNWLVYNDAANNTISLDTGKKIQGNNSILWEYSKAKDGYATAGYCPDLSKFVYGDGIKFSARSDKPVRVRLSVVVDDMQMYTFFTVGTEAKDYVLRWEDMGDFSATADAIPRWDPANNGFLNRLVFTIFDDGVATNPVSGNVWLDDFSFFSGSTPTIDEGVSDVGSPATGVPVAVMPAVILVALAGTGVALNAKKRRA